MKDVYTADIVTTKTSKAKARGKLIGAGAAARLAGGSPKDNSQSRACVIM